MNDDGTTWKKRVLGAVHACEAEFRRTTAIGMKMIHASRASAELHDCYEELGRHVARAIKSGELDWKDPQARVLMTQAEELEQALHDMEGDVQELKKS